VHIPSIIAGLAIEELVEPGSVRPEIPREALALVYAGLVAGASERRRLGKDRP
jgi:hypothetical protein